MNTTGNKPFDPYAYDAEYRRLACEKEWALYQKKQEVAAAREQRRANGQLRTMRVTYATGNL